MSYLWRVLWGLAAVGYAGVVVAAVGFGYEVSNVTIACMGYFSAMYALRRASE